MPSYIVLAVVGLCIAYVVNAYRCFATNLSAAQRSGIPYISMPIYTFNRFWLVTHRLWLPALDALPRSWTDPWLEYMTPDFVWNKLFDSFREIGSDTFLLVSPGANALQIADAEAVAQITQRRNDFPKPTWLYSSVDIYGKNVVSSEGAVWRHHRKVTSPPFTEKNNHVVWTESLHQAQAMLGGWVSKDDRASASVSDVAAQAMQLSLHVISRAGFGVRLQWPHEEGDEKIPAGHTMSYKDALSTLLENIIVVMLTPRWLLAHSPLKIHKVANESFVEWGKYMREMYQGKRDEVKAGGSREGMDLMGALVKGAGITAESLNMNDHVDPEMATAPSPNTKQLMTDDEILGNAFVFILAGHETAANTIHFSLLFLAMYPESQRRLQKDLDHILGDRPLSEWTYDDDVPKLFGSMCGAVMNEQLRLIPPVVGIPKSTVAGSPQGLQLDGKHVTVPGDCAITINTAALHRNPRYWPHTSKEDLLTFRPERWLVDPIKTSATNAPTATATQEDDGPDTDGNGPDTRPDTSASLYRPPRGAYVPFSDGYRSCLGRRFAQVEILAVLAVIFKQWSVELDVSMFEAGNSQGDEKRGKKEAWTQARERAQKLLREGMGTIITIQMRKGKVPMRFVKRGEEQFDYARD